MCSFLERSHIQKLRHPWKDSRTADLSAPCVVPCCFHLLSAAVMAVLWTRHPRRRPRIGSGVRTACRAPGRGRAGKGIKFRETCTILYLYPDHPHPSPTCAKNCRTFDQSQSVPWSTWDTERPALGACQLDPNSLTDGGMEWRPTLHPVGPWSPTPHCS